ncbi:MAG: ribonuclease P protein component [Vampirovibrionales bacterium]
MMLPKRVRLTQSHLFEKAMRSGFKPYDTVQYLHKVDGLPKTRKAFLLCALPQTSYSPHARCRFGLIVSKKTDKRAVVRNRIRRKLRELIRKHLPLWEQEQLHRWVGVMVIVGYPEAYTLSSQALETLLLYRVRVILRKFKPPA